MKFCPLTSTSNSPARTRWQWLNFVHPFRITRNNFFCDYALCLAQAISHVYDNITLLLLLLLLKLINLQRPSALDKWCPIHPHGHLQFSVACIDQFTCQLRMNTRPNEWMTETFALNFDPYFPCDRIKAPAIADCNMNGGALYATPHGQRHKKQRNRNGKLRKARWKRQQRMSISFFHFCYVSMYYSYYLPVDNSCTLPAAANRYSFTFRCLPFYWLGRAVSHIS